ncbi:MAG: YdjY domain-containing protein [Akkermansiaceae bacterium]
MHRIFPTLLLSCSLAFAQDPGANPPDAPKDKKPEIKQISEHEYQIGKISLDQKKREITFGAGINMTEGLLEYLIVGTQSNKVHEALFLTDISALNLNIALKLLGVGESPELFEIVTEDYRPTGKFPEVPEEVRAKSRIDILVEMGEGDKKKTISVNEMIHFIQWPEEGESGLKPGQEVTTDDLKLTTMKKGPWLSTGSYMHEGRFKAEVVQLMAAIYTAQAALINYPGEGRLFGDVWIPNKTVVPEVGTKVKIIIKPYQP